MKIIFINSHPISYFSDMYRFLNNQSMDINVWYCSRYGVKRHYDKEFNSFRITKGLLDGFNYKFLFNINPFSAANEKLLDVINPFIFFNLFKLNKGDLLICHGWSRLSMLFVLLFGRLFGLRIGLRAETPIIHEKNYKGFKKIVRDIFLRNLFKRIDYFFYIGTYNKMFYESFGINENQLIFMPYSVKPKKINYASKDYLSYKILFCGKLINKKRPTDLLHAFAKINNINLKLYYAGDGELRSDIKKYIYNSKLEKKVKLLGLLNQEDLSKIYNECDLVVLPSGYGETWGLVINEAIEYGLPVIVSDMVGCSVDLCDKNGYIFEYSNVLDLKEKIEKFYDLNIKDIELMRKESFTLKEKFSFSTISRNLFKIVQDVK